MGGSSEWNQWRFQTTTWLDQTSTGFETLMFKLDVCEVEPTEPTAGSNMMVGTDEITTEEEW